MSTIQIQKKWNPKPTNCTVREFPNKMEAGFFPNGHKLPKNEFTAEDLMGLSWTLFENDGVDN